MHEGNSKCKTEKDNDPLSGYANASFAHDKTDRKSHSGRAFIFDGFLVSWSSRKQDCVALSSTEAEFVALAESCQEACWLRRLLDNMQQEIKEPTVMFEDNQSRPKFIKKKSSRIEQSIDTREYFVENYVDRKVLTCTYCPTEYMLADLFAKPLSVGRHKTLRGKCGLNN